MMAAFRNDTAIITLPALACMDGVDPWRLVERTEILGAAEHGFYKLLVYNNYQPASDRRQFPSRMRICLCKAMVADAINYCTLCSRLQDRHACCGIVFGGNSHCTIRHWAAAFAEFDWWRDMFQDPQFHHHWTGALVAAAVKGFNVRFACRMEPTTHHHDTVYFKWSCEDCSQAAR